MIEFEGRNIPMTLAEIADPRRAVLLVWDMQNDQAGSSFNKAEFLRATPPLIAAAKGAGVRVVYAFATPYAWRDEAPAMIRRAMKDQGVSHPDQLGPRRVRGSFGWQPPFKPADDDILMVPPSSRNRVRAVAGQLEQGHRRHRRLPPDAGIEGRRILPGLFHGGRPGLRRNDEEAHHDALQRMERFAEVVDSRELLEIWGGPAGSG